MVPGATIQLAGAVAVVGAHVALPPLEVPPDPDPEPESMPPELDGLVPELEPDPELDPEPGLLNPLPDPELVEAELDPSPLELDVNPASEAGPVKVAPDDDQEGAPLSMNPGFPLLFEHAPKVAVTPAASIETKPNGVLKIFRDMAASPRARQVLGQSSRTMATRRSHSRPRGQPVAHANCRA
jgi:hypothetical protein